MKCDDVRRLLRGDRKITTSEDAEAFRHVGACATCQAWLDGKLESFVDDLRAAEAARAAQVATVDPDEPLSDLEIRGLERVRAAMDAAWGPAAPPRVEEPPAPWTTTGTVAFQRVIEATAGAFGPRRVLAGNFLGASDALSRWQLPREVMDELRLMPWFEAIAIEVLTGSGTSRIRLVLEPTGANRHALVGMTLQARLKDRDGRKVTQAPLQVELATQGFSGLQDARRLHDPETFEGQVQLDLVTGMDDDDDTQEA